MQHLNVGRKICMFNEKNNENKKLENYKKKTNCEKNRINYLE